MGTEMRLNASCNSSLYMIICRTKISLNKSQKNVIIQPTKSTNINYP